MLVVEVCDIVPMILEPMHRRAAFAKERGDIAFVRFFDHLGDRQVFPQIDYLFGYQIALLDPRIVPYYRKFFFENGLDYLAVADRIGRNDYRLTATVRERLRNLLKQR